MSNAPSTIKYLSLKVLKDPIALLEIYHDLEHDYYWSDDFSAEFYIAQAKAGFIAATETFGKNEILLPELQRSYAILDFDNLHIERNVKRLIKSRDLKIEISVDLKDAFLGINNYHKNSWLTYKYLDTLNRVNAKGKKYFRVISVLIRDEESKVPIAGEIGYIIKKTYTSLSGFSSKEKYFRNYGKAQMVLLANYLKDRGFEFWNLGHPYMEYKFALGAKRVDRITFLQRWLKAMKRKTY
ncbi:MAG: hypothetical protein GXO02_00870 [Epsilonproteobacteria bacterium]|nr:hypothetical protein [Campylobacterota bacterium]